MTEQHDQDKPTPPPSDKDPKDMTEQELSEYQERKLQQRIEEMRKRDPFIYR
jgi:hypothetical protein